MSDQPTNPACEPLREQLSAYIDGELSREEAAAVSTHLGACEACRAEERKLRKLTGLVAGLPRRKAPVDLAGRIMAEIRSGAPGAQASAGPAPAARSHAPAAQAHIGSGAPPRAHVPAPAGRRAIPYLRVAAVTILGLGLGLWIFIPRL